MTQSTMIHYQALLKASKACGMPKTFRTDLTQHDKTFLKTHSVRDSFAWYVYPEGTHMTSASSLVDTICRDFQGGHWFWWDGVSLREMSADAIKERLDRGFHVELGASVSGDRVQFSYRGKPVSGVVVRVKKDGVRTVELDDHEDEMWVDVRGTL